MSVTSCDLVNVEADEDESGYTTYTATYNVQTDSRTDGPKTVLAYSGVPLRRSTYAIPGNGETHSGAACRGRKAKLKQAEDTHKLWEVTITYSNNPRGSSDQDQDDPPGNPWDEEPIVDMYVAKSKKAILKDLDEKLISSSAGEPYDPVPEVDETKYMLRTVRNQLTINPRSCATFKDAINSDVFAGFPKFTVKCETPGIFQRKWHGGVKYYTVTWEFAVDLKTWDLKLLDYGMYEKVQVVDGGGAPFGHELQAIRDITGRPLTAPRLLDGNGKVLPVVLPPVVFPPVELKFRVYEAKAFAVIGLHEFNNV